MSVSYWHGNSMNLWGYDIFNSLKYLITEETENENMQYHVDLEMCAVVR